MFWGTNSLVSSCLETALFYAVNDLIPFRFLGVCVTCSSSLSESRNQNWFLALVSNCFVFISSVPTTPLSSILRGQSLTLSFGPSYITLISSYLYSYLGWLSVFSSAAPPPGTTLFCLLLTLCLVSNCIWKSFSPSLDLLFSFSATCLPCNCIRGTQWNTLAQLKDESVYTDVIVLY